MFPFEETEEPSQIRKYKFEIHEWLKSANGRILHIVYRQIQSLNWSSKHQQNNNCEDQSYRAKRRKDNNVERK